MQQLERLTRAGSAHKDCGLALNCDTLKPSNIRSPSHSEDSQIKCNWVWGYDRARVARIGSSAQILLPSRSISSSLGAVAI